MNNMNSKYRKYSKYTNKLEYIETLKNRLSAQGVIPILIGEHDTWASIDHIDDGVAYGMDQFDNDIELELGVDSFEIIN